MLRGVLILSIVKLVMNPYPCLDDLSLTTFFIALNLKFIFENVGALLLFLIGPFYAIMNSGFLWTTWLERFSGNANFFYF
jgi:GPI transamidase subunit PIG-U